MSVDQQTAIRFSDQRQEPATAAAAAISIPRNFWRSPGRAGFDIVPTTPIRLPISLRTMSNRATLAGHRNGAAVPATRQAAGVPSARSQPPPVTPARPRRWGDAGRPAAQAAADQKAGAPGRRLESLLHRHGIHRQPEVDPADPVPVEPPAHRVLERLSSERRDVVAPPPGDGVVDLFRGDPGV